MEVACGGGAQPQVLGLVRALGQLPLEGGAAVCIHTRAATARQQVSFDVSMGT